METGGNGNGNDLMEMGGIGNKVLPRERVGMGMGMTSWKWERLGTAKGIA